MKTTIEIGGHQILITDEKNMINVSALKGGESIEEFTIDLFEIFHIKMCLSFEALANNPL
jgi:hypothetical protein